MQFTKGLVLCPEVNRLWGREQESDLNGLIPSMPQITTYSSLKTIYKIEINMLEVDKLGWEKYWVLIVL